MDIDQYQLLVKKRDEASKEEQSLETEIFNLSKVRSMIEISAIIKRYRQIKDRRTELSVKAAQAFMSLNPKDRRLAAKAWSHSDEGQRNGLK